MGGQGRPRRTFDRVQMERDAREAATTIVTKVAENLARPPATEQGHQPHFLQRLERLSDRARPLALRLYYNHGLSRFVTRRALGLPPDVVGWEEDPAGAEEERVAFDLEPGASPSRLIVHGQGGAVTCLAPGMVVASARQVSLEALEASIEKYEEWLERQRRAIGLARQHDLYRLGQDLVTAGWLVPREKLQVLRDIGPAAGVLLLEFASKALIAVANSYCTARRGGGERTDELLRRWFCNTGHLCALLLLLADLHVEPSLSTFRHLVLLSDPVMAMIAGACFPRKRSAGQIKIMMTNHMRGEAHEDGLDPDVYSALVAYTTYLGSWVSVRRRGLCTGSTVEELNKLIERYLVHYERDIDELEARGEPAGGDLLFMRDLMRLGMGQRPDWGADLVDDPATLPPLRVDDLCLPGGVTSPRALRHLAQRFLAFAITDPLMVFCTEAELRAWRERLGPLDRVRPGTFRATFCEIAPPTVSRKTAGRNAPCPCGSGKKFKKCCLGRG